MPAFIPDGPDVPERLLQTHEEGRVVFFCGAGVSYPAGLPGFRSLVELVYEEVGQARSEIEETAFDGGRYDETLDLLERRMEDRGDDSLRVRKAVAKILEPKLRRKGAQDTHKGLLDLARDEEGVTRLVTTNFDRIFEHVNRRHKLGVDSFLAPRLPIPKATRWDGVVYLHGGLLSKTPSATELNQIVLSSGDFGLAYLNERWASRFVSELLRRFTVCFVGYSIEDPVLRYMMDALAADELLGEKRIESFAFASFRDGERDVTERNWRAKGVEPLLFDQDAGGAPFAVLHQTIQEWARVYTTGTHGKRMIVRTHAAYPPKTPSRTDYAAGRMLWALTDPKATKYFADLDPVPPLDWLEPFDEFFFDATDLGRFGVPEKFTDSDGRTFSMLRRPSPSTLSPLMTLASGSSLWSSWDDVMWHMARWLMRHLGNRDLILWIADRGGMLHPRFQWLIESTLSELRKLEGAGDGEKLSEIKAAAPDAIPGAAMRKLWRLALANRLKGHRELGFYHWFSRLSEEGLTMGLRLELRDLLRPCVSLAKPYRGLSRNVEIEGEVRVNDLVRWEVVLATDHPGAALRDKRGTPNWQSSLPKLLDDFLCLLKEALDLMMDLSEPEGKRQLSVVDLPSISSHSQNQGYHEWTALVTATREAWMATLETDPERAGRVARAWWGEEYPLFKRMAFFAAAQDGAVDDNEAIGWLLGNEGEWLWDLETRRESLRLLAVFAHRWEIPTGGRRTSMQSRLERTILGGPPGDNLSSEATEEEVARFQDRQVWLRLEKLASGTYKLGRAASARLRKLREENPAWATTNDEREEFPFWMEVTSGGVGHIPTPGKPRELLEWLENHPKPDSVKDDDWRDRCRTHFRSVAVVLQHRYDQNKWHPEWLDAALHVWAEDEELLKRSWRCMGDFLCGLSDEQKMEIRHGLSWWLSAGGGLFEGKSSCFFSLANDLIRLGKDVNPEFDRDIMFDAINHPIGQATEAVLKWWFRGSSKDECPLNGEARSFFTRICDLNVAPFRRGRVVLARATAPLHRVDPEWMKEHLLPLFDWETSIEEAKASWIGFLHSPRRIPALLALLKKPFLETSEHLNEIGEDCREVYPRFFTYVAIEPAEVFSREELRTVFGRFEIGDLNHAARVLSEVMEGSGDKAEVLWKETVQPFIETIWPKDADRKSDHISGQFAEICIAADSEFETAVQALLPYFEQTTWPDIILDKLTEKNLHRRFPKVSLDLIYRVVGEQPEYRARSLEEVLQQIGDEDSRLKQRREFRRLREIFE